MNRLALVIWVCVKSSQQEQPRAPWRRFKQFLSPCNKKQGDKQKDGEIRLFLAHTLNKGTLIMSFPMKMKLNQKKEKKTENKWKAHTHTHTPFFLWKQTRLSVERQRRSVAIPAQRWQVLVCLLFQTVFFFWHFVSFFLITTVRLL